MTAFIISVLGWVATYTLHLSLQPAYRRYAPIRFTFSASYQKTLRCLIPLTMLIVSSFVQHITGLFIWGFSAPIVGIIYALLCASHSQKRHTKLSSRAQ